MPEKEKVLKIKEFSDDIVRKVLHDEYSPDAHSLKNVVELLSRSVYDLSEMYLNDQCNHEETLKGTLAKMKIAFNTVDQNRIKTP
ncbi:hypothetical protein RFW18_04705 [Metabacillus idriensis]|uniref:hypothetical protein n=1 Tax=Metabacillus idriensis TaxID=324768 RepID=UPI002812A3FF|nr:hypothetical protein [Metabacillus idriensis]MDR0137036.1 hypothetical protein [Metabacillus idriensis]